MNDQKRSDTVFKNIHPRADLGDKLAKILREQKPLKGAVK